MPVPPPPGTPTPFDIFGLGGCACGCPGLPCKLAPGVNYHLSYLNTIGPWTGSATLTYMKVDGAFPLGPNCNWATGLFAVAGEPGGASQHHFLIAYQSSPQCYYSWDIASPYGMLYDPGACAGFGGYSVPTVAHTCSPLSIVFTAGTRTWTITP